MIGAVPLLADAAASSGWHYAAWVALDLRLLIFIILIAALVVKRRRFWDYAAVFITTFTVTLLVCLLIFNEIAQYPVFVIESVFPFP